ncbi:MAG: 16S rRNA processing protein RimM [Ruminococcaceae bacterium]|nr:16S rRNA processing protein RimM [Oscillospiraceae bacterium]
MKLIEIGQVVNTHGVRGEFKLNPWTDSLDGLLDYDVFYYQKKGQDVPLYVERIRIHKNCAIIKAEGVDTMEEAELLRGQTLFVERDENLPEGRYYIVDLIGLRVMTEEDEVLGIISDVLQTGANDVYEVRGNEKPIYLPVIDQVVLEVNIPEGYVRVAVPEGLLD